MNPPKSPFNKGGLLNPPKSPFIKGGLFVCLFFSLLLHASLIILFFIPFGSKHNAQQKTYIQSYVTTLVIRPKRHIVNGNKQSKVGEHYTKLLAFLHDQIQAAITEIDLEHNKEAEIKFNITANGNIENIRLTKSTGIAALDQIIVTAIKNTAPIPARFLSSQMRKFAIRIFL